LHNAISAELMRRPNNEVAAEFLWLKLAIKTEALVSLTFFGQNERHKMQNSARVGPVIYL